MMRILRKLVVMFFIQLIMSLYFQLLSFLLWVKRATVLKRPFLVFLTRLSVLTASCSNSAGFRSVVLFFLFKAEASYIMRTVDSHCRL